MPTVLVIDDDADLGQVLEEVLGAEGYRVVLAPVFDEAIRAVDDESPDVALLDWNLPDGDPEEVAQLLRDRGVPFVLTSGGDRTNERGRRIGAAAVLDKPFALDDLLRVLAGCARRPSEPVHP